MKTRREFIKTATFLTAGVMALKSFPFSISSPLEKMIGIQLYSLREFIPDNLSKILKLISLIGYNSIEPYGFNGMFFGFPPGEFKKMVEDNGMKLTSTHSGIKLDNATMYLDKAVEAGLEYLILPSFQGRPDKTVEDFKRVAEELNKIGEIANKAGIRFGYHNHDFEFVKTDKGTLYDILLEETEPDLVSFQLDIGWVTISGNDPIKLIKKYQGRFDTWHVKDINGEGKTTNIGNGVIDYKSIFKLAEISGMKRFYVEQERFDDLPLEEVERSYNYIAKQLI